jgi:hypothetical protein
LTLHVSISTVPECQNIRDSIRSAIIETALHQLFSVPYYLFYFDFILRYLSWALRAKRQNSVKGFLSPSHFA